MSVAGAIFAFAWDSLFAFCVGESLLNCSLKERSITSGLRIVLGYLHTLLLFCKPSNQN